MEIFPAIDLKNGQCVRLTQGDFSTAKIYEKDPLLQAQKFAAAGAAWIHIVDLDGAKAGDMQQADLIAKIAQQTRLNLQVGGGIRDEGKIKQLLDAGVARVVVGSLAIKDKPLVQGWLKKFGAAHITLAFDVKYTDGQPEVLTQGWQSGSQQLLWDVLDAYDGTGLQNILCTDIGRDGMLSGTNIPLYQAIHEAAPKLNILASGGVSGIEDLLALAKHKFAGAIVGKAIYEGHLDLASALKQVRDAG